MHIAIWSSTLQQPVHGYQASCRMVVHVGHTGNRALATGGMLYLALVTI